MARAAGQKLKLLYLKDYLEQNSDEAHPVPMPELLQMLERHGVRAERKSVYDDLELLREFGMDILRRPGRGGGYYLASRSFELPELKLLVDAVQASKFLSAAKSRSLIHKLEGLCSRFEAQHLNRQVVVSGRVKTMNESIYYNVDRLHEAIGADSQITFEYTSWSLQRKRVKRPGLYAASPLALVWADDYYYLIAFTQAHGITHYRVDKMQHITATGVPRVSNAQTQALDLANYSRQVFGMFGGTLIPVRLRVCNQLAGVMIDRFGPEQQLIPDGPDHFLLHFDAASSPLLQAWLVGFGDQVEIQGPESLKAQCARLCRSFLEKNPPPEDGAPCSDGNNPGSAG